MTAAATLARVGLTIEHLVAGKAIEPQFILGLLNEVQAEFGALADDAAAMDPEAAPPGVDAEAWAEARRLSVDVIGEHVGPPSFQEILIAFTALRRHATSAAPAADVVERRQFPILNSGGAKIDFGLVQDHGKQAEANHHQTVERLAERGGLSWSELHAVLNDRRFVRFSNENDAIAECRAIEARYLAALQPAAPDDAGTAGVRE